MKRAYEQYQHGVQSVHAEKVQRLVERAHIYNVTFLQNSTRVEEIVMLFTDEMQSEGKDVGLKKLPKIWEWLKTSESKACMS